MQMLAAAAIGLSVVLASFDFVRYILYVENLLWQHTTCVPARSRPTRGCVNARWWGSEGLRPHETCLLGDIAQVLPVAIPTRGSEREDALIDALRMTRVAAFGGGNHLGRSNLRH